MENEVKNKFPNSLTVGQLLEFIKEHNIPDDAVVFYQRIEDHYFEKNNWKTVKRKGEEWHRIDKWNKDIDSGKYLNKEQYPLIKPENLKKYSEEEMEKQKEEYIPAWSPVYYKDDNNLYIDAHS